MEAGALHEMFLLLQLTASVPHEYPYRRFIAPLTDYIAKLTLVLRTLSDAEAVSERILIGVWDRQS